MSTINEYHQVVNSGALDGKPVELLQGKMIHIPPEDPLHSNRIRQSAKVLRQQFESNYEVSETHPITLEESEPEPDIALVQNRDYDDRHPNADETAQVIEFTHSSLDKDLEEKRFTYTQANIPEYWVVNLRDRHVVVFRNLADGDYKSQQVMTDGVLSSPICNISIAVSILTGTH